MIDLEIKNALKCKRCNRYIIDYEGCRYCNKTLKRQDYQHNYYITITKQKRKEKRNGV